MLRMRGTLAFVILLCGVTAAAAPTHAESVRVATPQMHQPKEIDLPPGRSADVVVYLKSFGEMVAGFKVILSTEQNTAVVQSAISDENGIAIFRKVAPGKYMIFLQKGKGRRAESSSVSIGDYYLNISKSGN